MSPKPLKEKSKAKKVAKAKKAEARLSELLLPCYIHILMIAAIAQRQAATLTWMVSAIRVLMMEPSDHARAAREGCVERPIERVRPSFMGASAHR
jgi:hypothetical protein